MSFVIGIGVILVGSSYPKELARELIGICFVEERTTMLVVLLWTTLLSSSSLLRSETLWLLYFVDNGRMILLPIRSWIFPWLWRYDLYWSLLRN